MPTFKTIKKRRELFIEFLDNQDRAWGGFFDTDPKTARRHIGQEIAFSGSSIRVNGKIFRPSRPPTIFQLIEILAVGR